MRGSIEILYGIDYPSFNALKPFVFLAGGPFQGPYDVIIDDVWPRTDGGHHVGDTITIMNHPFRICGHRGARQRRAQAGAHRHHGRADGRRRQGLGLLYEVRRSGQ